MMKAIQVNQFVSPSLDNIDEAITMSDKVSMPAIQLSSSSKKGKPSKNNKMLVRVLACSISPGDALMVHGNMIFMHPDTFPFTPGMDICGRIVDSNHSASFKNGDIIVASNGTMPQGGMAEYMIVDEAEAVLKPSTVSVDKAAASSSAITARNAVLDNVKAGDRVLILGGSGGVGSAAIALAKHSKHGKASFVATTSTQADLCKSLGADVVIDYTKDNWWEMEWEQPFDKIIDTVGGGNFTNKAHRVLKPGRLGGAFIAVAGDDPKPDLTTVWKAMKFMFGLPLRPMYTWLNARRLPSYKLLMPYDIPEGRAEVLGMMERGELDVTLDARSPFAFNENGVKVAFRAVIGGHAHGKIVVSIKGGEQDGDGADDE
mmetsp:Transcript_8155/g.23438  ORF Transcript_8155/g.23438 Transcript_8155/m.23438 type:complete len:373 (+) Transcript_8155:103-1221(+)